jgi:hypothetical protein
MVNSYSNYRDTGTTTFPIVILSAFAAYQLITNADLSLELARQFDVTIFNCCEMCHLRIHVLHSDDPMPIRFLFI